MWLYKENADYYRRKMKKYDNSKKKSNITQAFLRKTGEKTEINSTATGIIDCKCAKCTKNTRDIVYYTRNAH